MGLSLTTLSLGQNALSWAFSSHKPFSFPWVTPKLGSATSKGFSLYFTGTINCLRCPSLLLWGVNKTSLYSRCLSTMNLSGCLGDNGKGDYLASSKHGIRVVSSFCSKIKEVLLGFLNITTSAISPTSGFSSRLWHHRFDSEVRAPNLSSGTVGYHLNTLHMLGEI